MLSVFVSKDKKKRQHIWRHVNNYPQYTPPHSGQFSEIQARENFLYFVENRTKRMQIVSEFFAEFDIELKLSGSAIDSVGKWLFCAGRHLLPLRSRSALASITQYEPSWVGDFRGMNVINDIAIFAGEYIIANNESVYWDLFVSNCKKDMDNVAYLMPSLFGITEPFYAPRKAVYMTDEILWACSGSRDYLVEKPPQEMKNIPLWFRPTDLRRVADAMANIKPMNSYLG